MVQTYLSGFRTLDRDRILGCLTEDIRWTVFGAYQVHGKAAYAEHITEPGFGSAPALDVVRMVEEGNTVMAELAGEVRADDGTLVRMVMAEVFVMRDGLICERRAFVTPLHENDYR
jgi:ketosteroid isomerase-like protein